MGPKLHLHGQREVLGHQIREKSEKFDFTACERALAAIGMCAHEVVAIGLTLPGGSVAKEWLASSAATGIFQLHAQKLAIATEHDVPLAQSVAMLLANWIISVFAMTELKAVVLKPWVIASQSGRAEFEMRIKEATVQENVQVDFSVGRHVIDVDW
jgi:hypothetical protein